MEQEQSMSAAIIYGTAVAVTVGEQRVYKYDPTKSTPTDSEGNKKSGTWQESGVEITVPWCGPWEALLEAAQAAVSAHEGAATGSSATYCEATVTAKEAGQAEMTLRTQGYTFVEDDSGAEDPGGGGEGGGGETAEADFANGAKMTVACTYVEESLLNHPKLAQGASQETKEACLMFANGASMAEPFGRGTLYDALARGAWMGNSKLVEKFTSGITTYMAPRFTVTLEKRTSSAPTGSTGKPVGSIGGFTPPGGAQLMGTGYSWDKNTGVATITYVSSGPGGFDKDIYPS